MGGDKSLETEVNTAVEDFRQGLLTRDYSKFEKDLQDDLKKRGAKDKEFEKAVTKELHDKGLLPNVSIEGMDAKGNDMEFSDAKNNKFALDKQGKATAGDIPLQMRFAKVHDHCHPVRPPGIGEFEPGEVAPKSKDKDWRSDTTTKDKDSTTHKYTGQLAWAGGVFNVAFNASEITDNKGKLLETHINYNPPINQTFLGPDGKTQHLLSRVKQVDTTIGKDGNYVTTVTAAGGKYTFRTNADGKILEMK